jgi:tRNA/tmRNA/rRNA uracil-C5-methylase (TrmA/RlmC/RlmD family)
MQRKQELAMIKGTGTTGTTGTPQAQNGEEKQYMDGTQRNRHLFKEPISTFEGHLVTNLAPSPMCLSSPLYACGVCGACAFYHCQQHEDHPTKDNNFASFRFLKHCKQKSIIESFFL